MTLSDSTRTTIIQACDWAIEKVRRQLEDAEAPAWAQEKETLTEDDIRSHVAAYFLTKNLHVRTPGTATGRRSLSGTRAVDLRVAGLSEIEMKYSRPASLLLVDDLLDDFLWFVEAPDERVMIVFSAARTSFLSKTRNPKPTNCIKLLRSDYFRAYIQDDARPLAPYLEQGQPTGGRWCLRFRDIAAGTSLAVRDGEVAYRIDFVRGTNDPLWAAVYSVTETSGDQAFTLAGAQPIGKVAM